MNRHFTLGKIALIVSTALLLLAACSGPGGPGGGGGGGGDGGGDPNPEYADLMLQLVNDFRAEARMCGTDLEAAAPPLVWNEQLASAASLHSLYLAEIEFDFGGPGNPHIGRGGSTLGDRLTAQGYDYAAAGENVAGGQAIPEEAIEDWTLSPSHCKTMMNPAYQELGAGHGIAGDFFYWTQNFGARR